MHLTRDVVPLWNPYRPSNGTEGEGFMDQWCQRCANDNLDAAGHGGCDILARALAFNIGDEKYPVEWKQPGTRDGFFAPICTAFVEKEEGQ